MLCETTTIIYYKKEEPKASKSIYQLSTTDTFPKKILEDKDVSRKTFLQGNATPENNSRPLKDTLTNFRDKIF